MEIGKEIFAQIKHLTPQPVLWSWGASKFQAFKENQIEGIGEYYLGGLVFYVRGAKHKGHVVVTLAGNDTYTVSIGHLKKRAIMPKKQVKEVYFDMLPDIIDGLIEKQDHYSF